MTLMEGSILNLDDPKPGVGVQALADLGHRKHETRSILKLFSANEAGSREV